MTVTVAKLGAPLPLAIVCGALFAGFIGVLLERLVIRHLYGRPLDTIVATWGISLTASQGTLILLGPSLADISTPLGSVQIGSLSYSVYRFVVMATASAILHFSICFSISLSAFCFPGPQSSSPKWPRRSASTRG